jgi:hypothetical protein
MLHTTTVTHQAEKVKFKSEAIPVTDRGGL